MFESNVVLGRFEGAIAHRAAGISAAEVPRDLARFVADAFHCRYGDVRHSILSSRLLHRLIDAKRGRRVHRQSLGDGGRRR